MKVFEIAGPVFTKQVEEAPNDDDWTRIEQGSLTSGEDIVLSKNGDRAVQALQLTDQDLELLKGVALGWADMSDLGDLEQDIYNYLVDNNPGAIHGGDDDPSDEIMDELESWFEDAVHEDTVKEWSEKNKKGESDYILSYRGMYVWFNVKEFSELIDGFREVSDKLFNPLSH